LKDVLKRDERRTPIVLGIQRGGLTTANIVAKKISCELDLIIPRKLTDPGNNEHVIGTVMEDGTTFLDEELANELDIAKDLSLLEGLVRP
jgi:putative phosphoribosyl transferase